MMTPEAAHRSICALEAAHSLFCRARFEMGLWLEALRQSEGWRYQAETFSQFLEEQGLNETAAYQYMRVAKAFFYDLKLSDVEMAQLATCRMGLLDEAARVATAENIEEVISIVTSLSERDAKAVLAELQTPTDSKAAKRPKALQRALSVYRSLPDDQRIDFKNTLRIEAKSAKAQ